MRSDINIVNFDIFKPLYSFLFKTDLVWCFSTAPGNYAVRDRNGSSPFIQSFCKEIQKKKRQTISQEITNYITKYLNVQLHIQ